MKYIKIVLKILLFIFLLAIIASFVTKSIVIDTFSQEILSKKISGYLLDEIFYDINTNNLGIIESNIKNSKITQKITSKFIFTITQNIVKNEDKKLNIEDEIELLISKYLPNNLSNEKLQNIKENVSEYIINIQERLQDNLLYSFGNNYLIILKIYSIITDIYFRVITIALLFIDVIILCILEKYNILSSIKNISLIITVFMLMLLILINLLTNFIDQRLAGGWLQQINTDALVISIVIGIIISILLMIANKIINYKIKEKNITKLI